jgi:enhancing lycopene biosynthesis protein 2
MNPSKNIAVLLSGAGHLDGAEIRESIFTLLALDQHDYNVKIFAPDDNQFHTVNHLEGAEASSTKRNMLQEAARIARGEIQPLSSLGLNDFDGLVLPGGFGVAKNFCSWAQTGSACEVRPDIEKTLKDFYQAKKPIAALCIAPALLGRVLGTHGITVTIGSDRETAQEIEKTGARHQDCKVTEYVLDEAHKIVTTPAYMDSTARIKDIHAGISSCINAFSRML